MKATTIFYLATFVCLWSLIEGAFGPKKLYSMDLPVEAVSVKVIGRELIIVGPWYIGGISNIHWKFRQSSRMKPRIINKDIPNPRAVGKIPSNAFKGSKALTYWVASWGTNDTSGGMFVMRPTTTYSVWKDISIDSGWSYERSQWVDMNRDGRVDCLTARFRGGVGQLLWFSQPSGQTLWGQQIIHEGMADGNFVGFVKGRKTYILVAGLQFSTLGLYWSMSRSNLWSTSRLVRHRVIDNYGKFYDVQYIDLNRDGRPDVLTTTVNIGNSRGHVLGYEVPDDIQNKIWNRRVLAAGFQGDYSPGKATAFWPNKWKRKADRPSVFLSGAGQEMLFILTPKPARTGWGYVKSSVKAGIGMIGLPFIGDIDGDSYPEVFVPQGNKLHIFSYDYNAAVAEPPASKATAGKVTPRPVVKFVPPFFRPTTPALPPLIPKGLPEANSETTARAAPSAGGLSGADAAAFGANGVLPSSGGSAAAPPLPKLPPLRVRGGPSSGGGSSSNLPAVPRAGNAASPVRHGGPANTGGLGESRGTSEGTDEGDSSDGGVSLWPVMTNVGPAYVPIRNQSPVEGSNAVQANSPQRGSQGSSPVHFPWVPGSSSSNGNSQDQSQASSNNQIVPLGSGGSRITAVSPNRAPNQNIVPLGGGNAPETQNQGVGSQNIVPLGGDNTQESSYPNNNRIGSSQNIVPLGGGSMEPVFEDLTQQPPESNYYEDYYIDHQEPEIVPPPNTILSITSESYGFREEAADACSFENKVLCSLQMLEASTKTGAIPLIEWGWFDMEGRAAQIQDCMPGEVKWPGFKCYNGVIGHLPVRQSTNLKGLCCAIMRGANVTDRKFSNYHDAEEGCKQTGSHICSLEEMFKIWEMSSYKSDVWGWFKDDTRLIKMVHTCNPQEALWPGYECLSKKLATSKIFSHVQESAYCCQNNSGFRSKLHYATLIFVVLFSLRVFVP